MKQLLMASVAAFTLAAGSAHAQTTPALDGLVNVDIQDVLQDIAVDLSVDETNVPVTLQVPVNVAANVCDVDVNVLSAQLDDGEATCTAVTGSQELTQIVQQEMAAGGSTDDGDETADSGDDTPTDDTADAGDSETDDTTTGSTNSAKEFAPGQQDVPANEVAPGQVEDPQAAAPGQKKKIIEE